MLSQYDLLRLKLEKTVYCKYLCKINLNLVLIPKKTKDKTTAIAEITKIDTTNKMKSKTFNS